MFNYLLSLHLLGWGLEVREYLFLLIIVLVILFLFKKILAKRNSAFPPPRMLESTPKNPIGWFVALSIGIIILISMLIFNQGSETTFSLTRTVTLITSLVIIFKSRKISWWYPIVAGLGIVIILLSILYPSMLVAHKRAEQSLRWNNLAPLIITCSNLSTSVTSSNESVPKDLVMDDVPKAPAEVVDKSQLISRLPRLDNNLAVIKAMNWKYVPLKLEPHPCELYMPSHFLAYDVSKVRIVVLIGPITKERVQDLPPSFWRLNMPILIFKWPEQELIASTNIELSGMATDIDKYYYRPRERHFFFDRVVAENLIRLLTTAQ